MNIVDIVMFILLGLFIINTVVTVIVTRKLRKLLSVKPKPIERGN